MSSFQRPDEFRFATVAVDLNRPVDDVKPARVPFAKNVRSITAGVAETRPGLQGGLATGFSPAHTVRRLNDKNTGSAIVLAGAGTHLVSSDTGLAVATDRDNGYSGDPLTLVPWRPDQSPQSWMYAADRSRMRKVSWDGATFRTHQIGLASPTQPPIPVVTDSLYKDIEDFTNPAALTGAGLASGPVTMLAAGARHVDTTCTGRAYDSGGAGFVSVRPASMVGIIPGTRLVIAGFERVTVEDVIPGGTATTIKSIIYQSGATGYCYVQLTTASKNLRPGGLVLFDNGAGTTEYAIVFAILPGPNSTYSLHCRTSNTFAAGHAATPVPTFRCRTVLGVNPANTLRAEGVNVTVAASGTGTLSRTGLALDLTNLATSGGYTLQARAADYMHIDLRADRADFIKEIKLFLDVDSATNDFARNYYWRSFRPDDLVPVLEGQQTAIQNRQQRVQRRVADRIRLSGSIGVAGRGHRDDEDFAGFEPGEVVAPYDDPIPGAGTGGSAEQLGLGRNQWSLLTFRLSDLQRVGTDKSRDLSTVAGIRISISTTSGGTVSVDLDSWWVGGGYGPDVAGVGYSITSTTPGNPYYYRFCYRSSLTGAASNFSPPSLIPAFPHRQIVQLNVDTDAIPAEVDKIDIQRFGGGLLEWHYVATIDVPGSGSYLYNDSSGDGDIVDNPIDGNTRFQPWPVRDVSRTGTTAVNGVSGIAVRDAAANFNLLWAPGTTIKVGGVWTFIYRVVSTSLLLVSDSLGTMSAVTWEIPEPLILGQPLPVLVGPVQGFFGACGDSRNPGRWYYSNGNDPDSTREDHYIEVTPPSEPLVNGIPNGSGWIVFSAERAFAIEPQFTLASSGANLFVARELKGWPGLACRWALCEGQDAFYWRSKDGIYASGGGRPESITDDDLGSWFPVEGTQGSAVNGIFAPGSVAANPTKFQLSFADSELYSDYIDSVGVQQTMVYNPAAKGWRPYIYGSMGAYNILCHRAEEGENVHGILVAGANGRLYRVGGTTDTGDPINCELWTPAYAAGDGNVQKLYGDIRSQLQPAGVTVTLTPYTDYFATALTAKTSNAAGITLVTIDLNDAVPGAGVYARNLGLKYTWLGSGPTIYFWQPSYLPRPEDTFKRATDYDIAGYPGPKKVFQVGIEADTAGQNRTVLVEYTQEDNTTATVALTVNHATKDYRVYALPAPIIAMELRLRQTDANSWKLYSDPPKWFYDEYPPKTAAPTPWSDLGTPKAKYLYGFDLTAETGGATIAFDIQGDDGVVLGTFNFNSTEKTTKPFVFATPPITHQVRVVPAGAMRIWPVNEHWFDFDNEPELTTQYGVSQQTSYGIRGFHHYRPWAYIGLLSGADVVWTITADGTAHSFTIASTAGARRKVRVPVDVIKGKVDTHKLSSASAFRLYKRDCEIGVKEFGSEGDYQIVNPFGDEHYEDGPQI